LSFEKRHILFKEIKQAETMRFLPILLLALVQLVLSHPHEDSIRPRQSAPDFKAKAVLNDKFIDVKLSDYHAEGKWTVLLFYPFDFTFVCPTEIISFSEKQKEFESISESSSTYISHVDVSTRLFLVTSSDIHL